MHGDTLCTDDLAYQAFRRRVRRPWVLALLRLLPHALRRKLAQQARAGSESAKAAKPVEIMDVNAGEVMRVLREQQVCRLIHGHTHRPGAACARGRRPRLRALGGARLVCPLGLCGVRCAGLRADGGRPVIPISIETSAIL